MTPDYDAEMTWNGDGDKVKLSHGFLPLKHALVLGAIIGAVVFVGLAVLQG